MVFSAVFIGNILPQNLAVITISAYTELGFFATLAHDVSSLMTKVSENQGGSESDAAYRQIWTNTSLIYVPPIDYVAFFTVPGIFFFDLLMHMCSSIIAFIVTSIANLLWFVFVSSSITSNFDFHCNFISLCTLDFLQPLSLIILNNVSTQYTRARYYYTVSPPEPHSDTNEKSKILYFFQKNVPH